MAMKLLETRVAHTVLAHDAVVTGQGRIGSKLLASRQLPPAPLSLGQFPLPPYSDERSLAWRLSRIPSTGHATANAAARRADRPGWGFGHHGSRSLATSASQTASQRFAGSPPAALSTFETIRFDACPRCNRCMTMRPVQGMRAVSTRGPM